ncbi:MAG: hypothetical protein A2W90_04950 [Bacteroidetes bacterium GWF2_42_66]|nr:MAG: hypothetical protein A2W89_21170 [Bacteroidetes bacterium GWE2_42_39]OFY40833.1 MAG: hypothetical protein A2W90_04950 [Bacteroidetes bacterium GWF2_42_66]HAZ00604.1 hypothetical protein [Marinilabiliales bacterium]HBL75854.1 hypothetical protein [Prolixibacteraceae bacterium]HCU63103.1 hypothetical protein [Prolixibacteraceae bacterium]
MNILKCFFLISPLFSIHSVSGQVTEKLIAQKDSLSLLKVDLQQKIVQISNEIKSIDERLSIIDFEKIKDNPIISEVAFKVSIYKLPSSNSEVIIAIPAKKKFEILGYSSGYFKVNYNGEIGYLNEIYIKSNSQINTLKNSNFDTEHYLKSKSTPSKSKGYYKDKTIYTGPRGGKYYINKNGNKTYIKN